MYRNLKSIAVLDLIVTEVQMSEGRRMMFLCVIPKATFFMGFVGCHKRPGFFFSLPVFISVSRSVASCCSILGTVANTGEQDGKESYLPQLSLHSGSSSCFCSCFCS